MVTTESYELQAAERAVEAAHNSLRAARGLRYPQLGLTGGVLLLDSDIAIRFDEQKAALQSLVKGVEQELPTALQPLVEGFTSPLFQADWSLELQKRKTALLGAELTLPLWMGGKIGVAIRSAALDEQLAQRGLSAHRNSLTTTLVERYFGVSLAEAAVELRREVVRVVERHLSDGERLFEVGMIPQADLYYLRYRKAEAERHLSEAEAKSATANAALRSLLDGRAIRPATPLKAPDTLPSMAWFRAMALTNNPSLREVELLHQKGLEGVKLKCAALLPEFFVMGGGRLVSYQTSDLMPRWAVGVGVRWRLFDGLKSEREYRAAREVVASLAAMQSEAEREVELLIESRYNELRAIEERLEVYGPALHFAQSYLESRRAAFLEGADTATRLMDAELELSTIRIEELEARYDYLVALARLLEASGCSTLFLNFISCTP